jgi:hypothetical protein
MAKQQTKRKRKVPMLKPTEMQNAATENVAAATRSFEGASRVTQEIASQIADYSKRSFEHYSKTLEKLLTAKSPDKAFEAQTEYARSAYEDYVSHATKLGELYTELAQETFKSYQDFAAKATPVR